MHIIKLQETETQDVFSLPEENFVFKEGRVQGAKLGKSGGALLVKEA